MNASKLEFFKAKLLAETNDIVLITDSQLKGPDGPKILYVNKAFEDLTGFKSEEVIGKTPRILQGPKTDKNTLRRISNALENKKDIRVELLNYSKDGREYWLDFSVTPLFEDDGNVAFFAAIERDVSQHKQLQENLYKLANQDSLTGAMNRNCFYEACNRSFAVHARDKKNFALMVIDIDDFKKINDSYGHLEGDEQLKSISSVCQSLIRQTDHFCRFGGDEFICLLHDISEKELKEKVEEILSTVESNTHIKATVSIGATFIAETDTTIDDLIARADKALYSVKDSKKGTYAINEG